MIRAGIDGLLQLIQVFYFDFNFQVRVVEACFSDFFFNAATGMDVILLD